MHYPAIITTTITGLHRGVSFNYSFPAALYNLPQPQPLLNYPFMCPEVMMMAAVTKEPDFGRSSASTAVTGASRSSLPLLDRLPFYRHATTTTTTTASDSTDSKSDQHQLLKGSSGNSSKSRSFDLAAAAAELYAVACTAAAAVVTASSTSSTQGPPPPPAPATTIVAQDNNNSDSDSCCSCCCTSTSTGNNSKQNSHIDNDNDNAANAAEDDIDDIDIGECGDALALLSTDTNEDCCTGSSSSSSSTTCTSAPDSCFEEEEIVMEEEEEEEAECQPRSQVLAYRVGGALTSEEDEEDEAVEADYQHHHHHYHHHHHHCRRGRCHSQEVEHTTSSSSAAASETPAHHQRHQRHHSSASACSRSDSKKSSVSSSGGSATGNNSDGCSASSGSIESLLSDLSGSSELAVELLDGFCTGPSAVPAKTSPWRKVRSLVTSPFIQTYKRQKYPWIQLAGHQGNFLAGQMQGTILKKKSGNEDKCFQALMEDELRHFVPHFKNVVHMNGESYIELEDLLASFSNPSIMDIKMGIRTYLEEELIKAGEKPKLRKDMYEKMVAIDPREPTEEEHALRAVTKPRYMVWRESISSTSTLGFRIDGVKLRQNAAAVAAAAAAGNGNSAECENNRTNKDFKRTKTEQSVSSAILQFAEEKPECIEKYLNKLRLIRETMARSEFFRSHEMIGSSLLFVHDDTHADIWLIDFAKTYPLPAGVSISHRDQWTLGNHEDGYLTGLDNLIRLFSALQSSNA